jgi:predicted ArsR family transcriptional regulator
MIAIAEPIDADALRTRNEFLSVPGLHASADDVAHALDLSERHARSILELLVREDFLERTIDGQYSRREARRL